MPCGNTCGMRLTGSNVTYYMQILHDTRCSNITEECTPIRFGIKIKLDGVPLSIEGTSIIIGIRTNHCLLVTIVDISRKLTPSMDFTTIHEFSKSFEVFCRTNLISTLGVLFECPRRDAQSCHDFQ